MLLKRLFVIYQRHIEIFLTMNSVIKVQSTFTFAGTSLILYKVIFTFCARLSYTFLQKNWFRPLLTTRMNMLNDYLLETAYFRTHGSQQLPVQWSGSAGKAINRRGLNILTVTSKIQ